MKKVLKIVVAIVVIPLVIFGAFLGYITLVDYKPTGAEVIFTNGEADVLQDSAELQIVSWNLGYCGLSQEMDFFYDGGQRVYPDEEVVKRNYLGIKHQLESFKDADFVLLQEVDQASKRSHFINQFDSISNLFNGFNSQFALNYMVPFVIVPISKPMGKVQSGIQILSKAVPSSSSRNSFIGNYAWPKSLFMLDRCFMVNRYPLIGGKELILINTHNEAYDDGGLRSAQLEQLKAFILKEYALGNFVIVGGDWNQCPPNFQPHFVKDIMDNEDRMDIKTDYIDTQWKWAYDDTMPTNRRVKTSYTQGTTLTTVIDFFLLSPNIELVEVKNLGLNFQYSDHQPVVLRVKLSPKSI